MRQRPWLPRTGQVGEISTTISVVLVSALHTRVPHTAYTSILFEDGKPALGVCVEVESRKDNASQA